MVFVGFFILYDLLFAIDPPPPVDPADSFLPHAPDYLVLAIALLGGLGVAVAIATRLARRLLAPLNSLAESARRIAAGDLSARAVPGDRSLGETARMVDDFNSMAIKLEDMAKNMASWNAAIAHELRTPLTILQGRVQGMIDGVFLKDEDQLRNLLEQVEGLKRLVDDLRVVTLQDSGRLEMLLAPARLDVEIQRAVELMRDGLREAGLMVEMSLAPTWAICDAARIRQAVLALLDNARRYAGPGRLLVTVERSGDEASIRVADAGAGLPVHFAPHAFELFSRADASRSRNFGGSGLGLSVVRAIAAAHRGQVSYGPSPIGGAMFRLRLPTDALSKT